MDIAFFDACGWDYDVSTPYTRPMGGSQSALCYLAAELADRGHFITLLNGSHGPRIVRGVKCVALHERPRDILRRPFAACIVLNGPGDLGLALRPHLDPATPLWIWAHLEPGNPWMRALNRPGAMDAWERIVCVSDWHRDQMIAEYRLDPDRTLVMRNAVAPAFERMFQDAGDLARAKAGPPRLVYTSTPFRGLDVLLDVWPEIHREFPTATLAVYSSLAVYQQRGEADPYGPLYDRCRATAGVRYVGSLAQPDLARELRSATMLAYPSTFAETSCIAVLEALAAGLAVVTSDLGALPETTMGWSRPIGTTMDLRSAFSAEVVAILSLRDCYPRDFRTERMDQVEKILGSCTWRVRAAEWERAIGP